MTNIDSASNQSSQPASPTPAGCPDEGVCKFKDEPEESNPKGENLGDKKKKFSDQNATLDPKDQAPQMRGNSAEIRGIEHNSKDHGDNKGTLQSGDDVGRGWKCEACQKVFEIDHILRDDHGKIIAIAEVKSGGPLRSTQGEIQAVLAKQNGLKLYKKVQDQRAIAKCEKNNIPFIDMNSTPGP